MGILEKIDALLQGKKTYIVAVGIGISAVLQILNIVIPVWVWTVLGAAGLGAIRSGINKLNQPPA